MLCLMLRPTTSEAARTQHLPAVNAGTPAIPDPEDSTDWRLAVPPPWPPDEAAEPPAHQRPKLIQALTDVGGALESLPSKAPWRAVGQMCPISGRSLEGKSPTREAHGRPPEHSNPQTPGPTIWEPVSVDPQARVRAHQARRLVLDEGAHTRPKPWPSLGITRCQSGRLLIVSITARGGVKYPLTKCGEQAAWCPIRPSVFFILTHTSRSITVCHPRTREFVAWRGAATE